MPVVNEFALEAYDKAQKLRKGKEAIADSVKVGTSLIQYLCLAQFLLFIAKNPVVLNNFKALLLTITSTLSLITDAIQLVIAQLRLLNQIVDAAIQAVRGSATQLVGFNKVFPFSEFASCPAIDKVKGLLAAPVKKLASKLVPKGAGNRFSTAVNTIKRWEFEIIRRKKKIELLEKKLEGISMMVEEINSWAGLIDKYIDDFIREATTIPQ